MLCSMTLVTRHFFKVRTIKRKIFKSSCIHRFFRDMQHALPDDLSDKGLLNTIKDNLIKAGAEFEDGYTCFKVKGCKFCFSDSSKTERRELFINKKTGNFLCHQCKISGSWTTYKNLMNLKNNSCSKSELSVFKKECGNYDITNEWKEISNECKNLYEMEDAEIKSVMQNFGLMPLKKEVVKKLNIQLDENKNLLMFPLISHNTVLGMTALDLSGNSSTFPKTECSGCLVYKNKKNFSAAVVVASVKDFSALVSLRLTYDIVCLPYSIATLPQNLLPHLEEYDKLILWLGIKPGAWNSSIQFAKKLIEKRCYLVRPTGNQISAGKAVASSDDVNLILKNAKPIWHQFVTTFSSLREDVLAEIQNVSEVSGVQWTRFPKLNKILKGHRRGELSVLTGPTGSGKTTFLSEYSLDLAMNGINTLWGSFEIKNSRLARVMLQQFAKLPLGHNNLDDFHYWANNFENLPIYFLTFHGQHSLETVMNAVQHCSYVYDIAHVIIDNVQFMIDISNETKFIDRFWVQDTILQAFRRFATANNCHVTLVVHPRKESDGSLNMNSIFGSAKTSQEADNIFIIQQETGGSRKHLQICKNRFAGTLGKMPLVFDQNTLSFSQKEQNTSITMEEEFILDENVN